MLITGDDNPFRTFIHIAFVSFYVNAFFNFLVILDTFYQFFVKYRLDKNRIKHSVI